MIPAKREQLRKLKAEHGGKVLGEIKVENALGGMRYSPPLPPLSCEDYS